MSYNLYPNMDGKKEGMVNEGQHQQPPSYPVDPGYPVQGGAGPGPAVPPPPYGYTPTAQTHIITQPVNIVYAPHIYFGDHPQQATCPNCRATVFTQVQHETGTITWLIAGGVCLLGCWLGCCLIPFCMDACKEAEHYCPNCKTLIGRSKKL